MKKPDSNKTGIKEIARLANVSTGTVDRVLHNRGEVAETTRQHILKIVDELGYTPNLLAKSLASKKKHIIAILIPEKNNNPYWEKPLVGIEAAAKEIDNYNFEIVVSTFDYSNENSFVEKAGKILYKSPDGLIFAPVFYEASLQLIKKCESLSIPYVFIDVLIEGCKNISYFGQDSVQSGYLAAKLMQFSMKQEQPNILILKPTTPSAPTFHLELRERGFCSYYSELKMTKIELFSKSIDISSPKNITETLDKILNNSKPDGIFVTNSRVHLIAKYLKSHNINNNIVIGYDLIEKNIEYIESGNITYLICQKPEEQGYKSILSIFNYLMHKKPVDKLNYSPIDIIMKENLEYYKNFKI